MAEPFIGEISMFAGNFAPRGWAFCDGQLLAISQNSALFSLLGTTYGGDGRTTFGLPDLRGRVPMHPGNGPGLSPRRLGEKGGSEANTLSVNSLPPHVHTLSVSNEEGELTSPVGNSMAVSDDRNYINGSNATNNTGTVGGGQAVNNIPPYLGVHFIIALVGIYPSRS